MLKHNTRESTTGQIDIQDVEPQVIQQVLQFIYTDTAPKLEQMAGELLAAADKYQLERLKLMCEQHLCRGLTAQNACDTLMLADRQSAKQLKWHTAHFINSHTTEVTRSMGWELMLDEHPQLVTELFKSRDKGGSSRKRKAAD